MRTLALTTCVNWLKNFNPSGFYLELDLPTLNKGEIIELVNLESLEKSQIFIDDSDFDISRERIRGTESWSDCPIGSTTGLFNSNVLNTDSNFICSPTTIPTVDGKRWTLCQTISRQFNYPVITKVYDMIGREVIAEQTTTEEQHIVLNFEDELRGSYLVVMCGEIDGGNCHCDKQLIVVAN